MKAMICSDLLAARKPLGQAALVLAVLLLVIWFFVTDSPLLILYAAPLEALVALQFFMADDNQEPWEHGRPAAPLSRAQVVAGRYAALALIALATIALAACLYLFVCAVHFAFPALDSIVGLHTPFNPSLLVLSVSGSLAVSLVELGIILPLLARESAPSSLRFVMAAAGLAITLGLYALASTGIFAYGALVFDVSLGRAYALAAGLIALGGTFYTASETIALQLYSKRDF